MIDFDDDIQNAFHQPSYVDRHITDPCIDLGRRGSRRRSTTERMNYHDRYTCVCFDGALMSYSIGLSVKHEYRKIHLNWHLFWVFWQRNVKIILRRSDTR
eukprot:275316_1